MTAPNDEPLSGREPVDSSSLYQPLDQLRQEIRLVRVLEDGRRSNLDRFDIECHMKIVPLQPNETPYIALSYCWTDAEATCTIYINKIPLRTRPNLCAFMNRMRSERQQSWIFVDALCVNQADFTERNQQVASMGDIFRNAAKVIAWLGEPIFESSQMEREIQRGCSHIAWCTASSCPREFAEHTRLSEAQKCAEVFLSPQYWTRVWTTQEIILASSLGLRAGSLSLDGKALGILCQLYERLLSKEEGSDERNRFVKLMIPLLRQITTDSLLIAGAIAFTASRECSEPHDKIYGLLGLTRKLIEVDYNMPTMELLLRPCIAGLLERKTVFTYETAPHSQSYQLAKP